MVAPGLDQFKCIGKSLFDYSEFLKLHIVLIQAYLVNIYRTVPVNNSFIIIVLLNIQKMVFHF